MAAEASGAPPEPEVEDLPPEEANILARLAALQGGPQFNPDGDEDEPLIEAAPPAMVY